MAGMQLASKNGGRGRRAYRPLSEINVTPFVDVMLVLLIVFMVTAPLLTVGVPVDLPESSAEAVDRPDQPLIVSITSDGSIYLQETEIAPDQLAVRLRAIAENRTETRIFVRGDRAVAYGRIMEVMGRINAAGFTRVALIAEAGTVPDAAGESEGD
jgi:biopolymer transport protein TolR